MNQQQLKMLKEAYHGNANNYKKIADYLKSANYRIELSEALTKLIEMLTESSDMMAEMLSKIEEVGSSGTWQRVKSKLPEAEFKSLYQGEFPPKDKPEDSEYIPPNFVPKDEARKPVGKANADGIPMITQLQIKAFYGIGKSRGMDEEELNQYSASFYNCGFKELTMHQASDLIDKLRRKDE